MNIPQTSSTPLRNPISFSMQSIQLFHPDQATNSFIPFQDGDTLPPQPFLSKLWINSKCRVTKFTFTFYHLFSNVREVTIGSGSLSVMFKTTSQEHSCYLEFVAVKNRWRESSCPSGIPLRIVESTELSPGCRELIDIAGCTFKTRDSTVEQHCKPIETRFLRRVMQSLGLCPAASGASYRVYIPRIGRPYFIVIIHVNHSHGDTQSSNGNIGDAVMTDVKVFERESVAAVVHELRGHDKNYGIALHGRKIVKGKFKGNTPIVLA